jgi:PAS domain S-box-containing protein
VRARESRLTAMLEAALDAVVTMDAEGRVVGWNAAAERIFGYEANAAIGREMAELIVPPALREPHRRGFGRFVRSGRGRVLDRRLELTGLRSDGSEFPVELTITRIAVPGPPMFTGYLRDITDRVAADRELRESRARWSRWPTQSASGSSATSTTARSSG